MIASIVGQSRASEVFDKVLQLVLADGYYTDGKIHILCLPSKRESHHSMIQCNLGVGLLPLHGTVLSALQKER